MQEYQGFDLERMFIGEFSPVLLAEIAVRTVVMYVYALAVVRFIGKRGLGQVTPFEFVIVIALGSATGDPMFYPEVPLVHGMMVLTMVVFLQKGLTFLGGRNTQVQHFVDSVPALLIENGVVREDVVRAEGFAVDELMMRLRKSGVRNVGQVEYAWLEPSGELSVFAVDSPTRVARSTFPRESAHRKKSESSDLDR